MILSTFKEKANFVLGARDVAWAFGSMLGPGLMFLLTDSFEFAGTFFFFASFTLIFGLIPAILMPNKLSQKTGDVKD